MLRFGILCTTLLFAVIAPFGSAQDKDKPKRPPLVTYYGQSFFTVTASDGTVVAFDPHAMPQYNRILGVKADIILLSHEHNEHNAIISIENRDAAKIIRGLSGPGLKANWVATDETIKGVQIKSVGVFHDGMEGMRYGKNTIFIIEVDGWRIAHMGDLGHELTTRQLRQIGPLDVVIVPVGGIYTLNGSEAKRVVEQLKPKEYIFPMHYGTPVFEDLLPIDEFLEGQVARNVVKLDDNKIQLNRDITRPRPLLVQLHYWAKDAKDDAKEKK